MVCRIFGFIYQLGEMQKSLGRDAATVQANTPETRVLINQSHFLSMVGRQERGGVSTGPSANDSYIAGEGFLGHIVISEKGTGGRV
jgi:hypothetical protein